MNRLGSKLAERLDIRRRSLGMSHAALAARSGVSLPTVQRVLSGRDEGASFATVMRIAEALGVSLVTQESDADEFRLAQARAKAREIARLVQGTSALEAQAVDAREYERLVERSVHELLAGSRRKLWSA